MPRFAHFDPTLSPAPVKGWYDTDLLRYPNPPPEAELIGVPDAIWDTRHLGYAVVDGTLVETGPPPPDPD